MTSSAVEVLRRVRTRRQAERERRGSARDKPLSFARPGIRLVRTRRIRSGGYLAYDGKGSTWKSKFGRADVYEIDLPLILRPPISRYLR